MLSHAEIDRMMQFSMTGFRVCDKSGFVLSETEYCDILLKRHPYYNLAQKQDEIWILVFFEDLHLRLDIPICISGTKELFATYFFNI